ncbi:MAG: DapH/DapD/GlmU-related protein, partial [Pseudomonadota bacterium]|nr:DapH/DapD/GlmU-related protein [Pseudomonadota bacterium]
GSSTMGTLSGGNDIKISIGENCLLGANSGLGIPLGNNCIVEAGLYLTAGTKLRFLKDDEIQEIKAADLSGMSDILFRRNSITGVVEAISNSKDTSLNPELHKN